MRNLLLCLFLWPLGVATAIGQDTLKVGIFEAPPFVIAQQDGELSGVSLWLWDKVQQDLGQPYKLIRYSGERPLKTVLQDLESGKLDLCINPLTITAERDAGVDFSYPFYISNLTIAKVSGSGFSEFIETLAEFFNRRLLVLIFVLLGMLMFFGFLIWLVERGNHHFEKGLRGLLSSFWWSAVTMTTVGYGDKVPLSNWGRLLAFIWMLCSVIIISVFTASITSNLTIRQLAETDLSLDSFKQTRVGTVEASASNEFLERNFFRDLQTYPDFVSGLKGLMEEEVAFFIYDEPWLVYQLHHNPALAQMEILPIRFNMSLYAISMREDLNPQLKALISSSIVNTTESRDWEALLAEYQLELY